MRHRIEPAVSALTNGVRDSVRRIFRSEAKSDIAQLRGRPWLVRLVTRRLNCALDHSRSLMGDVDQRQLGAQPVVRPCTSLDFHRLVPNSRRILDDSAKAVVLTSLAQIET
jgi:hypothetical protein